MTERARASLCHFALPATVLLVMTACLWLFWRQSHATNMPISERRLHDIYSLEPGEFVRLIPRPGIPERVRHIVHSNPASVPNAYITVRWDGEVARPWLMGIGSRYVAGLVFDIGIERTDYEIESTLGIPIPGDVVVRHEAPIDDKIRALETVLHSVTGKTIKIERRPAEREVLVVTGAYAHRPVPSATKDLSYIHLYSAETLDEGLWTGGGSGRFSALLQSVGNHVNRQVIDHSTSRPTDRIAWSYYIMPKRPDADEAALQQFLRNVEAQTSLTFTREKRTMDKYFVREAK